MPLILDANGEARNHFVDEPGQRTTATRDEALRTAAEIAKIPAFRSGGAAQVASDGSAMTLYTACRSAHRSLFTRLVGGGLSFSAKQRFRICFQRASTRGGELAESPVRSILNQANMWQ